MEIDKLNKAIENITERFRAISRKFVARIAQQIIKYGELSPATVHQLTTMRSMNQDIAEINMDIAEETTKSLPDIMEIYQKVLSEVYTDPRFRDVMEEIVEHVD